VETKTDPIAEDVVCGMQVKTDADAIQSSFEGKTFYFCAEGCKRTFEKDPAQFAAQA
jgi:Cu+-exporting ATPase